MGLVGENFKEELRNQVAVRQSKWAVNGRSIEDISVINSNSWLRLASSVNISTKGAEGYLKKIAQTRVDTLKEIFNTKEDDELAKNFVLTGGSAIATEAVVADVSSITGLSSRSGINTAGTYTLNSTQTAYGVDGDTFGYRPMPGLESATVSFYNRGTLSKADIKIKANSPEQLSIIELLYMRPGYTILLEWGHEKYYDNTGAVAEISYSGGITDPFKLFFKKEVGKSVGRDQMQSTIDQERTLRNYNYDAFYGVVTNFNWSVGNDGTYDITINAISTGAIVESLKITTKPSESQAEETKQKLADKNKKKENPSGDSNAPQPEPEPVDNSFTGQLYKNKERSVIHNRLYDFIYALQQDEFLDRNKITTILFKGSKFGEFSFRDQKAVVPAGAVAFPKKSTEDKGQESAYYIIFDYLLILLELNTGLYSKDGTALIKQDLGVKPIVTIPGPLSSDPGVCWIPPTAFTSAVSDPVEKEKELANIGVTEEFLAEVAKKIGMEPPEPIGKPQIKITAGQLMGFNEKIKSAEDQKKLGNLDGAIEKAEKALKELRDRIAYIEQYGTGFKNLKEDVAQGKEQIKQQEAQLVELKKLSVESGTEVGSKKTGEYTISGTTNIDKPLGQVLDFHTYYTNTQVTVTDGLPSPIPTPDGFENKEKDDFIGYLNSVYLNIEFIVEQFESNIDKDGNVNIIEFLQGILTGVSAAFGDINVLKCRVNDDTNTLEIYDEGSFIKNKKTQTVFKTYGVAPDTSASLLKNLSISAKISKEFTTMISVGAQANSNRIGTNATGFGEFNRGLVDRIDPVKVETTEEKTPYRLFAELAQRTWNTVQSAYPAHKGIIFDESEFKNIGGSSENEESSAFDLTSDIGSLKSLYRDYAKFVLGHFSGVDQRIPPPFFIPFDIDLSMKGLSGVKIYSQFGMEDTLLPQSYTGKVNYVVTNVTHKISKNNWDTDLKALTVPALDAEPGSRDATTATPSRKELKSSPSSPRVTATGKTWDKLNTAQRATAVELYNALIRYNFTDKQARAVLGIVSKESGFIPQREGSYKDTSAARIRKIFEKRFNGWSDSQIDALKVDDNKFYSYIYQNIIGNGDKNTGDGYKFRGRGLNQLTGRANYEYYQNYYVKNGSKGGTIDIVNNPDSINQKDANGVYKVAVELCALYYVRGRQLHKDYYAQYQDDQQKAIYTITKETAGWGKPDTGNIWQEGYAKATAFVGTLPETIV